MTLAKPCCIWLLLTGIAFAEDVVRFDPATSTYQGCVTLGDTTVFLTDPNDLTTAKPGYLVLDPLTCRTASFAGIPDRYRKVAQGQVVVMTQAEQEAVDAPGLALVARRQQLAAEQATNPYCVESYEQVSARVEAISNAMSELREAARQLARCMAVLREQGR